MVRYRIYMLWFMVVWIYVDVPDFCKYIPDCYDQYTRTCNYDISWLNVCVISLSDVILSFNCCKLYIIYGPKYKITIKWFIYISGSSIFEYHAYNSTGLKDILQTRYVWIISYMLKPSMLFILLHKVWYRI